MSAQDNLSDKQFFHGSPAELSEGSILTPGATRGVNNFPPAGDNSKVWMSSTPYHAWLWGNKVARSQRRKVNHVYEVEPLEGLEDKGHEATATSARVVRKVNTSKTKKP